MCFGERLGDKRGEREFSQCSRGTRRWGGDVKETANVKASLLPEGPDSVMVSGEGRGHPKGAPEEIWRGTEIWIKDRTYQGRRRDLRVP